MVYFVPACVWSGSWADFESCSCIGACAFRFFPCICMDMHGHAYIYMLHAYACICMLMHAYAWLCMHIHAYACICMHMHGYACLCMHMHTYTCKCMHMHACTSICMPMHAYACISMDMHAYASICMHTSLLLAACRVPYEFVFVARRDSITIYACVVALPMRAVIKLAIAIPPGRWNVSCSYCSEIPGYHVQPICRLVGCVRTGGHRHRRLRQSMAA